MTAPTMAPTMGATQNSHSWLTAMSGPNTATPVERAGLTEVLVTGMEMVDQRQAQADGQAGKAGGSALGGGAQDHDQEDGGHHHLGHDGGGKVIAAGGVFAVAVGGKASNSRTGLAGGNHKQNAAAHNGAQHLRNHMRLR